jgi:hypothetical protein
MINYEKRTSNKDKKKQTNKNPIKDVVKSKSRT